MRDEKIDLRRFLKPSWDSPGSLSLPMSTVQPEHVRSYFKS